MRLSTSAIRFSPVILIALFVVIFAILVRFPVYGADIYYVFYPSASKLLGGTAQLYVTETNGVFNPAHAMLYWMILALMPLRIASALHAIITLALLFLIIYIWNQYSSYSMLKTALAIAGVYTIDHFVRGQMDVMALFGLVLAFSATKQKQPFLLGAGATLAMVKPTNLLLPLFLIAWSLRNWSLKEIALSAIIPLLSLIVTVAFFGITWFGDLLQLLTESKPDILAKMSIWDMTALLNMPVIIPMVITLVILLAVAKYRDLTVENIAFAISANLLISTYVAGYHYVALIPAILLIRNHWLVVLCWLLSWLPFARLVSDSYGSLPILLPVCVAAILLFQMMTISPEQDSMPEEAPETC